MKAMQYAVAVIGIVGVLFLCAVFGGYSLSIMWGWFIVTAFGVPALNIPQAIGISMAVRLVTYQSDAKKEKDSDPYSIILHGLLYPAICLALGWIVKQFL